MKSKKRSLFCSSREFKSGSVSRPVGCSRMEELVGPEIPGFNFTQPLCYIVFYKDKITLCYEHYPRLFGEEQYGNVIYLTWHLCLNMYIVSISHRSKFFQL